MDFERFLAPVNEAVPEEAQIHFVLHKSGAEEPTLIHNRPTRRFAKIEQQQIHSDTFRRTRALETAITKDLAVYNGDPKQFMWHIAAQEILKSLGRYCEHV